MAGGRPTEYSEQVLIDSKEYVDSCEDEITSVISGQSDSFTKYEQKLKVNIPTIEGLARYLKIHRSTVYAWQKEHPEFSDIIEELQQKQAERLLSNGLSGDYNSTIAKVLLTKHGYTDKQEINSVIEDKRKDLSGLSDEDLETLEHIYNKIGEGEKEV